MQGQNHMKIGNTNGLPTPPKVYWLKYSLCVACKEADLFKYLLFSRHCPRGLYFDTKHVCVQWAEGFKTVRLNRQDKVPDCTAPFVGGRGVEGGGGSRPKNCNIRY